MWKIGEAVKRKPIPVVPDEPVIGIEIEMENVLTTAGLELVWEIKDDHSLRNNGKEFCFSQPMAVSEVPDIIRDFMGTARNNKYCADLTAGIHVHLQVSDMEPAQLINLMVAYAVLEPDLFRLAGMHRAESRFCRPWWNGTAFLGGLIKALCSPVPVILPYKDSWRYSALNMAALTKFGTVEFRQMECTLDAGRVIDWVTTICKLRSCALALAPAEVLDTLILHPGKVCPRATAVGAELRNSARASARQIRLLCTPQHPGPAEWTIPDNPFLRKFLSNNGYNRR